MNGDRDEINIEDMFAIAEQHRNMDQTLEFDASSSKKTSSFPEDVFVAKRIPMIVAKTSDGLMSPPKLDLVRENRDEQSKESFSYRLHEFWRGNNEFCLNGRYLSGLRRTSAKKILSLGLVLLLLACYMLLPLPLLYSRVSKILALMPIYMLLITVFFYVLTIT
jgi:hypothetical protein